METITLKSFMYYFNEKLMQLDKIKFKDPGTTPVRPILIVYLGHAAMEAHPVIVSQLNFMWPQYQNDILYFNVTMKDAALQYAQVANDASTLRLLDQNTVHNCIEDLYSTERKFRKHDEMFVYYIYDTDDANAAQDIATWITGVKEMQTMFAVKQMCLFTVLLDEEIALSKKAIEIRNYLSTIADHPKAHDIHSLCILSKRRDDNAILPSWEIDYKIIAKLIALSNTSDAEVTRKIFYNSMMTAGYAIEQKPSYEIAQVVIQAIIAFLDEYKSNSLHVSFLHHKQTINEKFKSGIAKISQRMDEYIKNALSTRFPSTLQLELFPRIKCDDTQLSTLHVQAFNQFTMHAWDGYEANLIEQIRSMIHHDTLLLKALEKDLKQCLLETCTFDELRVLKDHQQLVIEALFDETMPSEDLDLYTHTWKNARYAISNDETVKHVFQNAMDTCGQDAEHIHIAWNQLVQSCSSMHNIEDHSIVEYYKKKMQDFFDHYGDSMKQAFSKVQNVEQLQLFLKQMMDTIIYNNPVFSEPFEEELKHRLNKKDDPHKARDQILSKLKGKNIHTYVELNSQLHNPLLSAVFLNEQSSLSDDFKEELPEDTFYYHTGNRNAAEIITVYTISAQDFVK